MTDPQSQALRSESVGPPGHVSAPGPAVPYTPPPAPVASPEPVAVEPAYVPPPPPVQLDPTQVVSPIGGPDAPTLAEIEQFFALDSTRGLRPGTEPKSVRRAITLNLLVPGLGSGWIGETKRGAVLFLAFVLTTVAALLSTPMFLAGIGVSIYAVFEAHAGTERYNSGELPREDLDRSHTILIVAAAAALIMAPVFS